MDRDTLTFSEAEEFINGQQTKSKVITPQTADSTLGDNLIHDFSIEGANLFTQSKLYF